MASGLSSLLRLFPIAALALILTSGLALAGNGDDQGGNGQGGNGQGGNGQGGGRNAPGPLAGTGIEGIIVLAGGAYLLRRRSRQST